MCFNFKAAANLTPTMPIVFLNHLPLTTTIRINIATNYFLYDLIISRSCY